MPRKKDKKPKVTDAQIDVLCTFFEENPEIVVGYKKTPKSLKAVFVKWQKITPHLNSLGIQKTPGEWAKFLRSHRANLKHKRFKWKQNRDGSGPIICNADDFGEIGFRMLQVFRRDASKLRDLQTSNTSCIDSEANVKAEQKNDLETIVIKEESNKDSDLNDLERNEETPHVFVNSNDEGDEFDMFARNMAHQLRALPMDIAMETQEMMWSVMFKQRLKVLNDAGDPLGKKST